MTCFFANLRYTIMKWQSTFKIYTNQFLVFSINNFVTTYFNCYFFIRTDHMETFISITFHEIIVKPDFENSSNEAIKLSISLAVAYGVFSFEEFAILVLLTMMNQSARKMLNKRRPSIDPRSTPKTIYIYVLYELFNLVPSFLLINSYELIIRQAN